MNTAGTDRPFLWREEFPCPYIPDGRTAAIECLLPSEKDSAGFDSYLAAGYRRFDSIFYRTCCSGCAACVPLRISAEEFVPSRGQRRTLRRNEDISVVVLPYPEVTQQKILLYEEYLRTKHGPQETTGPQDTARALQMVHHGYDRVVEMNYFSGSELVGVGILDAGSQALSANYFYYDTRHLARRLGIFSILQEILLTRRLGFRYYYLGFYIAETGKMSYKAQFRPHELFRNNRWLSSAAEERVRHVANPKR